MEAAINQAKKEKFYALERIEYSKKLSEDPPKREYTMEQIYKWFLESFKVDPENEQQVRKLCLYFSNDKRFEDFDPSYSLEKGLFLIGGVGVGKTTLMRFFSKNQRLSYRIISCRDIESKYAEEGEALTRELSINPPPVSLNSDPFGHNEIGYCFDDLGTEANGKFFGKDKNIMAEIILNRYDKELHSSTHITTNLTSDEVKQSYGTRVHDRVREMFNVIKFDKQAKSRRK